jgi:hypothetical protein
MSDFHVAEDLTLNAEDVIHNPDDAFFAEFLAPYYVLTTDYQYLFASTQPGRRPDRAFYMVPPGYRLGARQQRFDPAVGRQLYAVVLRYLRAERVPVIVQEGIQGETGYEVGLRITLSVKNPHSAYIGWFGRLMVFPPRKGQTIDCWNYVVQEPLPASYVAAIQAFWPEFDNETPITLYDMTRMDEGVRRVLSLRVDYFGGAFKKPNLTMVWNKGEADGLISYHAGCTTDRVLKGLSGTGKTTLTLGPELEQDDALLGLPVHDAAGRIVRCKLIGLEAASYAKSEGCNEASPEWPGLMKSLEVDDAGNRPIVLAQNIDCENVDYTMARLAGHHVKVPSVTGGTAGHLTCTRYEKSRTTNGRFVFKFSDLNPTWGSGRDKWLTTESLSYKRFDVLEPAFRVADPTMAVALDSACESVITSAIAAQKPGTRVRSYAATDFMCREQSHQALAKLKLYRDLGLGLDGVLVFFINNAGYVGEYDLHGNQIQKLDDAGAPIPKIDRVTGAQALDAAFQPVWVGQGEKITVQDSKRLVDLIEHRRIERWIEHPVYGYLIPDPRELETVHGMPDFGRRFNLLRFYTPEEIVAFHRRDIRERTDFLTSLFRGQEGAASLQSVVHCWETHRIPSPAAIRRFYETHYGPV